MKILAENTSAKNRTFVLVALSLITFVISMDMMSINLIIPAIAKNFSANLTNLQWIITAFTLVSAIFTVMGGKLGDMFGQRKMVLIGVMIFCISSLLAGISYSANMLTASRALQGLGYAFIIAISNVIVSFIYPKDKIGAALGILAGMGALAAALGPVLIAVLIEYLNWRWVFYINLPISLYAVYLIIKYCPKIPVVAVEKRFDYLGALFMGLSLFLLLLGLNQGADWGITSKMFMLSMVTGFVALLIFILIEKFTRAPLLPLAIFTDSLFFSVNMVRMIVSFVMSSLLFSAVLYLEVIFNYTPMQTGLLFLLISVAMIFSAIFSGKLIDRVGPYQPLIVSCIILILFYGYFGLYEVKDFGLVECILYFMAGLAFGILRPGIGYIIIRITPEKYMGVSNALSSTVLPIGAMLGVAISGWILNSQSIKFLNHLLAVNQISVPSSLMPLLHKMAQGVYGAIELQTNVSLAQITQLTSIARQAFLHAYSELMMLSAGLFLIAAVLLFYANRKANSASLAAKSIEIDPGMVV